jgi:flotillin
VAQTQIEDLQVVDGGDGDALGSVLAAYPAAVARVLMETGHAVGVDIAALLVPRNAEGERPIEAEPVSSKPGREGEPS